MLLVFLTFKISKDFPPFLPLRDGVQLLSVWKWLQWLARPLECLRAIEVTFWKFRGWCMRSLRASIGSPGMLILGYLRLHPLLEKPEGPGMTGRNSAVFGLPGMWDKVAGMWITYLGPFDQPIHQLSPTDCPSHFISQVDSWLTYSEIE